MAHGDRGTPHRVSEDLASWLARDGERTVGSLIDVFGEKSFALLFVLLLGVSALPLPTGGATHVFDVIAVLLAVQLIADRDEIWLPDRWRQIPLAGARQQRFISGLMKAIARLERVSRPRWRFVFRYRFTNIAFGVLVIAGTVGAFFAPPFSGLDTLPAAGVVLVSLGILLEDVLVVLAGVIAGVVGVVLEIVLGAAALHAIGGVL